MNPTVTPGLPPRHPSCTPEAFEARYRQNADPWGFATSAYEARRYQAIVRALRRPPRGQLYENVYEPGCSIGELTVRLAPLCRRLQSCEISPTAAASARRRCAHLGQVEIRCEDLTQSVPSGAVDLIAFSEIGYYFLPSTLIRTVRRIASHLSTDGEWVAAHWLGRSADHVLHGQTVHSLLRAHLPLRWVSGAVRSGYRIDTWIKRVGDRG